MLRGRSERSGHEEKSRNDRYVDAVYSCNMLRWLVVARRAGRSLRSSQGAVAICVSQPCVPTSVEHVRPSPDVPSRIGIFRTYPQRLLTWSYSFGCPNRVANVVTIGLAGFCAQRGSLVSIDQVNSLEIAKLKRLLADEQHAHRELQHRVGNELASVQPHLFRQYRTKDRSGDCLSCVGRIEGIVGLHQLLNHCPEQPLDIAQYLLGLAENLNAAFAGPVKISAECEPIALDPQRCGFVGLIFNEACTNAFKYAFPGGQKGQVKASFRSFDDQYHLTVSDDGRGYDPSNAKEGYGTAVMRRFANQLSGKIEMTTGNAGTSVSLAFPRNVPITICAAASQLEG